MTIETPASAAEEQVLHLVDHIQERLENSKPLPLIVKQLQACCGDIRGEKEALERRVAQLEERLRGERKVRLNAETENAAKDQALVTVAHELRGPVAATAIWANLMRRDPLSPTQCEAVEMIEQSVGEEFGLINDLLDTSRATRGRLSVEPEPVDVAAAVRSEWDWG